MEKIKLGSYTVPTSFKELPLGKWAEYVKYASECKEKEEDLDLITTLTILSDIPRETIMQMPMEMFEKIYDNLSFLTEEVDMERTAHPNIIIDKEHYEINFMEQLKVHEYLDVNTTLDNNKYDYPMILAILCRKKGEQYNDDFIANELSDRYEMYSKISVDEAFPLIGFFLALYAKSQLLSRNYMVLDALKEEGQELVKHIESSLKATDFITPSKWKQISKLAKLKRFLKRI